MESECDKCKKKNHCSKCCRRHDCEKCCKRGPRGFQGQMGPPGIQGPTGPAGSSEPSRGTSNARIVEFDSSTQDPNLLIGEAGPGDFEGQMGLAFATNTHDVVIFFFHNDLWKAL